MAPAAAQEAIYSNVTLTAGYTIYLLQKAARHKKSKAKEFFELGSGACKR